MNSEGCYCCHFFHARDIGGTPQLTHGFCQRFPPVDTPLGGTTQPYIIACTWCGEFKRSPVSIALPVAEVANGS